MVVRDRSKSNSIAGVAVIVSGGYVIVNVQFINKRIIITNLKTKQIKYKLIVTYARTDNAANEE